MNVISKKKAKDNTKNVEQKREIQDIKNQTVVLFKEIEILFSDFQQSIQFLAENIDDFKLLEDAISNKDTGKFDDFVKGVKKTT